MTTVNLNGLRLHLTDKAAAKPGLAKALAEGDMLEADRLALEIREEEYREVMEEMERFLGEPSDDIQPEESLEELKEARLQIRGKMKVNYPALKGGAF